MSGSNASFNFSYHFYIAFENSVCKDYITEKLWSQGYQRTIIPIVLKRDDVEPFVPPNSFIAADDFEDVKSLAAYLHYLIHNETAYMSVDLLFAKIFLVFLCLDGSKKLIFLKHNWTLSLVSFLFWSD